MGGRGAGKLTDKLINELTIYYGLAIRHNPNDVEKMSNDVWATFEHKISTKKTYAQTLSKRNGFMVQVAAS